MRSIELKILLIKRQLLLLNGNQTKERVFLSKLPSDNFKWNHGDYYQWLPDTWQ